MMSQEQFEEINQERRQALNTALVLQWQPVY